MIHVIGSPCQHQCYFLLLQWRLYFYIMLNKKKLIESGLAQ